MDTSPRSSRRKRAKAKIPVFLCDFGRPLLCLPFYLYLFIYKMIEVKTIPFISTTVTIFYK